MVKEQFFLFWGERPFSQWSPADFVIDGKTYNSTEQYMMAMKARHFGDEETLRKIMKSTSPSDQKKLGRQVRGFDANQWNKVCRDIVYKGNYEKFKQNSKMREKLFETVGRTLVEASPKDKIWGIGLSAKDERCQSRETWQGKNWLGEVLTKVRDNLLKEKENGLR